MVHHAASVKILLRVCVALEDLDPCPVPDRCLHGWECSECGRLLHYDPATPVPAEVADRPEVTTCQRETCWGRYVRQA